MRCVLGGFEHYANLSKVWQLRLRILLNNYSNASLFRGAPSHFRFFNTF